MDGEFELDWGEFAESALSAATVVGAFDPGDDREAELVAGRPGLPVQDVLLQQRKNESIAALSPAAATRPIDPDRWCVTRTRRKALARNCDPRSE